MQHTGIPISILTSITDGKNYIIYIPCSDSPSIRLFIIIIPGLSQCKKKNWGLINSQFTSYFVFWCLFASHRLPVVIFLMRNKLLCLNFKISGVFLPLFFKFGVCFLTLNCIIKSLLYTQAVDYNVFFKFLKIWKKYYKKKIIIFKKYLNVNFFCSNS